MRNKLFISLLLFYPSFAEAQSLGGSSIYNFLHLSNTPQLTALGGINISQQSSDVGLGFNNPALLRSSMHTRTNFAFNNFTAGIRNYHVSGAWHSESLETTFGAGINFFDYGSITATDAAGNIMGSIRPSDYVVQVSAARSYLQQWHYGLAFKFVHSAYGQYRSSGLALDLGLSWQDSASSIQAAFVAKNMGLQLGAYAGSEKDALPFDMQIGLSKKLQHAPLQFSLTAHHLHQWDIQYRDTAFNNENGFDQNDNDKKFSADKLFRHVVLSVQCHLSDKVEISAGYNHLRRRELNAGNTGNGLNGFSFGVGVLFKKLQLRYARSNYQRQLSWNQFGLSMQFSDYIGAGKVENIFSW